VCNGYTTEGREASTSTRARLLADKLLAIEAPDIRVSWIPGQPLIIQGTIPLSDIADSPSKNTNIPNMSREKARDFSISLRPMAECQTALASISVSPPMG
jgi:hypothetical protein